jgi:hypothetical protein
VLTASLGGGTWTFTLTRTGNANGALAAVWYQAIETTVGWHAQTAGSSLVDTLWQEMILTFEDFETLDAATTWPLGYGFVSHLASTSKAALTTREVPTGGSDPSSSLIGTIIPSRPVRLAVSRAAARTPTLYPVIRTQIALTRWMLSQVGLLAVAQPNARVMR